MKTFTLTTVLAILSIFSFAQKFNYQDFKDCVLNDWIKVNKSRYTKYEIISKDGKIISDKLFSDYKYCSNNTIIVRDDNHNFGLYSCEGDLLIPCQYDYLAYDNGYYRAEQKINGSTKCGYIDSQGATIIPFKYSGCYYHINDKFLVLGKTEGSKYSELLIIDKNEKIIHKNPNRSSSDPICFFEENNAILIYQDKKNLRLFGENDEIISIRGEFRSLGKNYDIPAKENLFRVDHIDKFPVNYISSTTYNSLIKMADSKSSEEIIKNKYSYDDDLKLFVDKQYSSLDFVDSISGEKAKNKLPPFMAKLFFKIEINNKETVSMFTKMYYDVIKVNYLIYDNYGNKIFDRYSFYSGSRLTSSPSNFPNLDKYLYGIIDFIRYKDGYCLLANHSNLEITDVKGNTVLNLDPKYKFASIENIKDSLIIVKNKSKYGVINLKGDIVIEFEYDYITEFVNGIAAVRIKDKWGYINTSNEVIIPVTMKYKKCSPLYGNIGFIKKY